MSNNREVVIIQHQCKEDVAMIAAEELAGILETAQLLCLLGNAERLQRVLAKSRQGEGSPQTVAQLRQEVGLE